MHIEHIGVNILWKPEREVYRLQTRSVYGEKQQSKS